MRAVLILMTLAAAACSGVVKAQVLYPAGGYVQLNAGSSVGGAIDIRGRDAILGPVSVTEDFKPGPMGSALVGRRLGPGPISLEVEGLYVDNEIDAPDLNAAFGTKLGLRVQGYGGLANLKLEAPTPYRFSGFSVSPYVAGGVGYGQTNLSVLGDHYIGDGFMWQAKAGLSFQTGTPLSFDLGYRYVGLPEYTTNQNGLNVDLSPGAHVVSVGVKYSFGPG